MVEKGKKEKPPKKASKASKQAKARPASAKTKSETLADQPACDPDAPESAYEQGMQDASILFRNSSVFGYKCRSYHHLPSSSIGTSADRSTFENIDRVIADAHQLLIDSEGIISDLNSNYSQIEELDEESKKTAIEQWRTYLITHLKMVNKMALLIEKVLSEIN